MEESTPSAILDLFKAMRNGQALDDLDAKLIQATEACVKTGKKSTLDIKLVIELSESGEVPQITIGEVTKLKLPEAPKPATLMFISKEGKLTRRDPRQVEIPGIAALPESKRN